ncbi:MAG: DUF2577 domain-containing protein [Eubacterium sp.]|nr:DUF2577 domain-containing protein [Eubacterium sp.]
MADSDLLQVIRRIAVQTVAAGKPCDYVIGTVKKENPLEISVSKSLTLYEEFLDLLRNVTDFDTEVTIQGSRQKFTVHNSLKEGEKVLMIQKPKGQRYLILDRVVSET